MAYTPPHTFAAGALTAANVESNVSAIQKYLDGGMVGGDLAAGFVQTRHIMRPAYDGTKNVMTFVTGIQGGKSRTVEQDTGTAITRWNTARTPVGSVSFDNAPRNYISNASVEIDVPRNMTALIVQYTIAPQTPYMLTTGIAGDSRTEVLLYAYNQPMTLNNISGSGTGNRLYTKSYTFIENNSGTLASQQFNRRAGAGVAVLDVSSAVAGKWYIGLVGKSDFAYTKLLKWTISVEGWFE